jgi:hypothetical protein
VGEVDPLVEPLRIAGFTRVPHVEMIARVRDAIGAHGGFILDSHLFSNAVLSISFEIRGGDVEALVSAMTAAGLLLDAQSSSRLAVWDASAVDSDSTIPGMLSINFVHDDPPLRIEVPAVPG